MSRRGEPVAPGLQAWKRCLLVELATMKGKGNAARDLWALWRLDEVPPFRALVDAWLDANVAAGRSHTLRMSARFGTDHHERVRLAVEEVERVRLKTGKLLAEAGWTVLPTDLATATAEGVARV